jgi:pimeloyl-ACP methyl ester carboxylesterase
MVLKLALVLLVLLTGLGWWLYTPDLPRAELERRYLTSRDHQAEIDGTHLRWRDSGPTDRPALLLVHGLGSSLETWQPWVEKLAQDYRVVSLDLPGFGLSGPDQGNDYSDRRTIHLLVALLDHLQIARASLIGHSIGGRIAWQMAALAPDRVAKLVLIAPDGFASPGFEYGKAPEIPILAGALPYVLPTAMLRPYLRAALGDPHRLTAELVQRYRDMLRAPGVRRAVLQRLGQTILQDPRPLLARITAPTLLLWGDKDQMIPSGNSQDYLVALPESQLVLLPGLGHVLFEEAPAQSLPPLQQFLAGEN